MMAGDQTSHHAATETSPDKMIGSLGDALAGVNLNQKSAGGGFGYNEGNSDAPSSNGAFASNGQYIGETSGLAWGSSAFQAGGSGSDSGFSGANSLQGMGRTSSADQVDKQALSVRTPGESFSETEQGESEHNLLFGGMPTEPSPPSSKQSLELFLSQSPSKSLGGDLLKLNNGAPPSTLNGTEHQQTMNRSTSALSLEEMGHAPGSIPSKFSSGKVTSSSGDLRQASHDPTIRRKADSPSCSVTATSASSRSASPYAAMPEADKGRTIQAFPGTELPGSSSRSFAHPHATNEVNRMMSSQPKSYSDSQIFRSNNVHQAEYSTPYVQGMEPPTPQYVGRQGQQPAPVNNAPQVLYMAVPTPDGRGQMLQPVQMVQLQGQPSTFVLPQTTAGVGATQPAMVVLPTQNVTTTNEPTTFVGGASTSNWSGSTQYSKGGGMRAADNNSYGQYGVRTTAEDYTGRQNQEQPYQRPAAGETINSLYSTPQRPPLDELLGNVRRLSRDQVGCRLLQQALDEEGPMAATMILSEGLSFWGEAMVDPFGNYLFQKILETINPEERVMLIKTVSARLVNASLNLHGTRSVQKVVEMCAVDEASGAAAKIDCPDGSAAEILTRSLAPAAARLCIDSHGNHVIQRILLKLGHEHAQFVFDAVAASVGDVARHRHGCCVIQRCLDSPPSEARSRLVQCIVEKSLDLMQDAYGNYVVQYVLDVCEDADVHAVCESVVGRVSLLAIQKFSSNVMEKCLERCTDHVKECYLQELSDPERIRELMMDPFGNYVVQRALSVASHAQAVRLVEAMRPHLIASSQPGAPYGQRNGGGGAMRNTAGGRRIMAKICRRFPNFTLSETATSDELYSQNKGQNRSPHRSQHMSSSVGPPGLSQHQQALYGAVDSQRVRRTGDQNEAYYEQAAVAPPGYYDHMRGHASYPPM